MKFISLSFAVIFCTIAYPCSYDRSHSIFLSKNPKAARLAAIVKVVKRKDKRFFVVEKSWTTHLDTYPLDDSSNCRLSVNDGKKYLWLSDAVPLFFENTKFAGFTRANGILLELDSSTDIIEKLNSKNESK